MEYRKDIDALRAFAVLSVLFYHADSSFFRGGYIGVDIFFVISGFLITKITVSQIEQGNFSFLRFYSRRVLRLLPVLVLVVLFTLVGSFFLLDVNSFSNVGGSTKYTGLISTNHFFLQNSQDYFQQGDLKSNPLLHLWSLSVEEQFYLLFPFAMFMLNKAFKAPLILLSTFMLSIASFWYSSYLLRTNSSESFYLLWSRSWELLAGSILALVFDKLPLLGNKKANVIYVTSISCLLVLIYIYSHDTSFPGVMAFWPALLTCIAIYSGKYIDGQLKKLVTLKPIIFIGFISYSLYLWHWPIFVFSKSKILDFYSLPRLSKEQQIILALALSTFTYYAVEQPFRKIKLSKSGMIMSLVAMASIFTIFYQLGSEITLAANGNKSNFRQPFVKEDYYKQLPTANNVPYRRWQLSYEDIGRIKKGDPPLIVGDESSEPSFILVGDSYASMWGDGLDAYLKERRMSAILLAMESCSFLKNLSRKNNIKCFRLNKARLDFVRTSNVDHVILASSWKLMYNNTYYEFLDDKEILLEKKFEAGLLDTLEELKNKKVSIVLPHVSYNKPAFEIYLDNIKSSRDKAFGQSLSEFKNNKWMKSFLKTISEVYKTYKFEVIDPNKKLCPNGKCLTTVDGKILIHDSDHLNIYGSSFLVDVLFQSDQNLLQTSVVLEK